MLKKIILGALCATSFFSASLWSAAEVAIITINLRLEPNEIRPLVNRLFNTITATCILKVNLLELNPLIEITATEGSGVIDGKTIRTNESISYSIHNNQNIDFEVESGASLIFHNPGIYPLEAACSR